MKLGARLEQIKQLVSPDYDHAWDCCCDHGYLGQALLEENHPARIHFVDIVPDLIDALDLLLQRHKANANWQTHCMDVAELPIRENPGKHLIIIAGIGGDLMIDLIKRIQQRNAVSVDFLLCPVYHQFAVRKHLIQSGFKLLQECLVQENRRFYEIIKVAATTHSSADLPNISLAGEQIWRPVSEDQYQDALRYLKRTLEHYRRVGRGNQKSVQPIIDAYSAIEIHMAEP